MRQHIALLRGVNVSGANRLPMAEFRVMLGDLGLTNVQTYIASGNAVFRSDVEADRLAVMIREAIAGRFGFAPEVFMVTPDELRHAAEKHPFGDEDAARVHAFFLEHAPGTLDDAGLQALALPGDGWQLRGHMFHLHTPAGIGRSKLAERLNRFLPGSMTARNLRTVRALAAMTHA